METCGYTHDVFGERFADLTGETWTCERPARDNGQQCLFHASPDVIGEEVVREALLTAVQQEEGPLQLLGAHLGGLNIDYAILDAPITYAEPVGYLTFGVEGFVSLVLGLPTVTGSVLGLLVAIEGFLGGFVIALFVFTLTRSISR